jgi:Tat protein translocase TatB subunit
MLNVGPLELVVVLAVALIVVGPERLPELARAIGRAVRQLRDVQNEVRDMVSLGVDDEVREAAADFKKATSDLRKATDVRGAVHRTRRDLFDERTAPTSPGPSEPEEAGGAPADRMLGDGSVTTPVPSDDAGNPRGPDEQPRRP